MVLTQLKKIKYIFLDVDGVLTDGRVLVNEEGEQWRTFSVKDGYAIQYAIKQGLRVIIITGARSLGVQKRFEGLGVQDIFLNISDKITLMEQLCEQYGFDYTECLFIGDDIPDLECMRKVGVAICPADAAEEIKKISHYVSTRVGGNGIVRETLEKVLKLQDKWHNDSQTKSV
ncbi:MAG TPA: HAD-IIIA family hydrolase [Sphingobacterium sp.]|nr:HAD-IIIA family hydrolase [Sphingobacterium sp.]